MALNVLILIPDDDFFDDTDASINCVRIITSNLKRIAKSRGFDYDWKTHEAGWKEILAILSDMRKDRAFLGDQRFKFISGELAVALQKKLSLLLAKIFTDSFGTDGQFHSFLEQALVTRHGQKLNNTLEWIGACDKHGLVPYLLGKKGFIGNMNKLPEEFVKVLSSQFAIHVLFDAERKYDEFELNELAKKGQVVIGHDSELDKVVFSVLPFLVNEYRRYLSGLQEPYLEQIREFTAEKFNGVSKGLVMTRYIPPFVSLPASKPISYDTAKRIYAFFVKTKTEKAILKGGDTARSSGSALVDENNKQIECPYLLVCLRGNPDAVVENLWYELENYRIRYGKKDYFMIQAYAKDDHDINDWKNIAIATHKANVVGDRVSTSCVKMFVKKEKEYWSTNETVAFYGKGGTALHYFETKKEQELNKDKAVYQKTVLGKIKTRFDSCLQKVNGYITGSWHSSADLSSKKEDLRIIGEFMNLVSPYGAHALDITFGDIGDGVMQMFLLEANGSDTRGDIQGTNYFTDQYKNNKTIFDDYIAWAKAVFNKDPAAAGRFTKHMISELNEAARAEYIVGVQELWRLAKKMLTEKVVFCRDSILLI